jgi:hypothetical protein
MTQKPFASPPDSTSPVSAAERLLRERTQTVRFCNPPGYEAAHSIHPGGRAYLKDTTLIPGARDRGQERDTAEFGEMRRRRGMEGESLSVKGRPVK